MTPTAIATVLREHELATVQAVKPPRTLWRCACGHEREANTVRHSVAQAKHQSLVLAAALRKEARAELNARRRGTRP